MRSIPPPVPPTLDVTDLGLWLEGPGNAFAFKPPPLVSPQPMPLQTMITGTTLDGVVERSPSGGASADESCRVEPSTSRAFVFESAMAVPFPMVPAIGPRLAKALPEFAWCGETASGSHATEGRGRQGPHPVEIAISHRLDLGFRLKVTVEASDAAHARSAHAHVTERVKTALLGWSRFHRPDFKVPADAAVFDRDEVVDLLSPIEQPRVAISHADVDIVVSQFLLHSIAAHGESSSTHAGLAHADPSDDIGVARARQRGSQALLILTTAGVDGDIARLTVQAPNSPNAYRDVAIALDSVVQAKALLGDLLANGLAEILVESSAGRPATTGRVACRQVHVRWRQVSAQPATGLLSIRTPDGEDHGGHEILRVDDYRPAVIENLFVK